MKYDLGTHREEKCDIFFKVNIVLYQRSQNTYIKAIKLICIMMLVIGSLTLQTHSYIATQELKMVTKIMETKENVLKY